jgi:hypothetical protein
MKVRTGFVSNSSSASFIIKWKFNTSDANELPENEKAFDEAFRVLFDIYSNDDGSLNLHDMNEIYAELKTSTTYKDGKFETIFWTSMYNDVKDFGTTAAYFNLAIDIHEGGIKLISRHVENE